MISANYLMSMQLATEIEARPRRCFLNSLLAVLHLGQHYRTNAWYVEGFAGDAGIGIPIEHAWVETTSALIDVTWCALGGLDETLYVPSYRLEYLDVSEHFYNPEGRLHFPLLLRAEADLRMQHIEAERKCRRLLVQNRETDVSEI